MNIMDNAAQNLQSNVHNGQQQPQSKSVPVQQQVSPVSVPSPVSHSQKEAEPIGSNSQTQEYIKPSEIEPVIPKELAEHGVEAVPNHHTPALTDEQKALGINHAKETVPVSTVPTGKVQLPISVEEAAVIVKQKKVSNSISWIAALVLKHAKMIHQKLTTKE